MTNFDGFIISDADHLFEQYLANISLYLHQGSLLDKIADRQNFKGFGVRGTTFQLGFLHQAVRFVSDTLFPSVEIARTLLRDISEMIDLSYSQFGFSYLEEVELPPDLDTLAVTVAALAHRPIVLDDAKRLLNSSWRGEFPSVFLAADESKTREYMAAFFCGDTPWHVEVLINAMIAEHILGEQFLNISIEELVSLEPINYWYIPSTFTLFRLAQLCHLKQKRCPFLPFEAIDRTSAIPQMRKVFLERRCGVLEKFLYEVSVRSNLSWRPLEVWQMLATDDPIVYASIGFQPYRSRLLYESIFMMALALLVAHRGEYTGSVVQ